MNGSSKIQINKIVLMTRDKSLYCIIVEIHLSMTFSITCKSFSWSLSHLCGCCLKALLSSSLCSVWGKWTTLWSLKKYSWEIKRH